MSDAAAPPARPDPEPTLPAWLEPVRRSAAVVRGKELSRFLPPEGGTPREGAVLVLFGEGPAGPDLLLTERAHHLRAQPAQVSFPGGSLDPGETAVQAALRETFEETGIEPDGVDVFGVLPRLYLPPRNFAVAPVLGYWRHDSHVEVVNRGEVHAIFRVPVAELLEPANRFTVTHPLGWKGPGWLIGPDREVLLWGFTAGIIDALFTHAGWTRAWDRTVTRPLPERLVDWDRRRPPAHRARDHGPAQ